MKAFKCKNNYYLEQLPAELRPFLVAGKVYLIKGIRVICSLNQWGLPGPVPMAGRCSEYIQDLSHSECRYKLNGSCKGYLFITSEGNALPARAYKILTKVEATVYLL